MGIGMIFIGYFGVSVLGLALVPPSGQQYIAQYDMNNLVWVNAQSSTGITIDPPGQLLLNSSASTSEVFARDGISPYQVPLTWEIRVAVEFADDFSFRIAVVSNDIGAGRAKLAVLVLHKDSFETYISSIGDTQATPISHVSNQFYNYRIVMTSSTYTVFRDDVTVGSGVLYSTSTYMPYFVFFGLTSLDQLAKGHVDYFYAVTSAVYPTYQVNLSGYCNTEAKAVIAQVQADGANQKSTPCTYDFAIGTSHQIVVIGSNDVHSFLGWDSQTNHNTILVVSSVGSHVAHYEQATPTTYTVDVSGFCDSEASSVSVSVVSDGNSKQTPCSFTYNIGSTHTITAPTQDPSSHPFLGWDSSTSGNLNLQVSDSSSHIAHYKQGAVDLGTLILVTLSYYDNGSGLAWNTQGNIQANAYKQNGGGWDFVKSVTTSSSGYTVGEDTKFGVGIYKFEATWQGVTNNTIDENQPAIGGEYWSTTLYLGHGPLNENPFDLLKIIRDFLASDIGKGFMLYGGVGVTAIGSVLFVYPKAPKFLGFIKDKH
jgi:hypothetical protein